MSTLVFTCPCCGFHVHDEPTGSYRICPLCDWEDDEAQLMQPLLACGPNYESLYNAQQRLCQQPVSAQRALAFRRDPKWRLYDPVEDAKPHAYAVYYWLAKPL